MDDDNNNDNNNNGFGTPASPPPPLLFGLLLCSPLSPSISEDDNNEIEKDLTPAQVFLPGDTAKALPLATREKGAFAEKVRFSENLNKLFPKADAVFENNDQKPFEEVESLSRPEMTTIPHTQVMFRELNEGKLAN